ncbi:MAG: ATP-binding protein [Deltaproteobacteria bacterium]
MTAEAAASRRDDGAVSLVRDRGVILHVEDDEATRFVVRRVLESAGFSVRSAGTTAAAAALLEGADVAVLDMNLPDGTGIDLCRAIKNGPREQRVPVMILSATSVAPQDRARGLEMGADAYLTHPLEPMVLVATVRALVRARHAERDRDLLVARLSDEVAVTRKLLAEREDLLRRERRARAQAEDEVKARRSADLRLEQTQQRLRSIYESPLIGILWARQNLIFEANDEFLRIVGYTREDLPLDWRTMTPEEYAPLDDRAVQEMASTGRAQPFEKEYVRKDGSRVPIEIGALAFGPDEWACFVLDISARKQAEEVQKALLGIVSHDLRSPLSVIQTSVDLLDRLPPSSAQIGPVRERIRGATARIDRIISDLLDFTRVQRAGGIPVLHAAVDLDAVCRSVIAEIKSTMPDRAIEFTSTGDGVVSGDPDRIAQMMDNLIGNALKFSTPGTPVCVHRVTEGGRAVLRVANAAAPIPAEARAHLFDAFYRAPQPQGGTRQRGSGLGLFIARAIAEAHGGTIALAHSDAERGTEFRVELPLTQ